MSPASNVAGARATASAPVAGRPSRVSGPLPAGAFSPAGAVSSRHRASVDRVAVGPVGPSDSVVVARLLVYYGCHHVSL